MIGAWIAALTALWALVLLIGFLVLGTLRRVTGVLERVEQMLTREPPSLGAEPMTVIPRFELHDETGDAISSDELLLEAATLLLFVEANCVSCLRLIDQLEGVGERLEGVPFYVVISDTEESRRLSFPPLLRALYQEDGAATQAFSNRATPQAYTVGNDRFVLERRLPSSLSDLREMAAFQRNQGGDAIEHQPSKA